MSNLVPVRALAMGGMGRLGADWGAFRVAFSQVTGLPQTYDLR